MGKDLFISDLRNLPVGTRVSCLLMVKSLDVAVTKNGSAYMSLRLGDNSGQIPAKLWDVTSEQKSLLAVGSVYLFNCRLDSFRDKLQLVVDSAEAPTGAPEMTDYVKGPQVSLGGMKGQLLALVGSISDPDIRSLVSAVLARPETECFFEWPAAMEIHHAYAGGLLEHSLSVARLADMLSGHYQMALNRDMLLAGAILHDLGKCWEISGGAAPEYTIRGNLMGHTAMGALFLELVADSLPGFPQEKLLVLEHMVLSHHGEMAKGAPVTPKTIEAVALHYIDELDARLNSLHGFISEETSGREMVMTGYHRRSGSSYLSTPSWGQGQKAGNGPDQPGKGRSLGAPVGAVPGSGPTEAGVPPAVAPAGGEPGAGVPGDGGLAAAAPSGQGPLGGGQPGPGGPGQDGPDPGPAPPTAVRPEIWPESGRDDSKAEPGVADPSPGLGFYSAMPPQSFSFLGEGPGSPGQFFDPPASGAGQAGQGPGAPGGDVDGGREGPLGQDAPGRAVDDHQAQGPGHGRGRPKKQPQAEGPQAEAPQPGPRTRLF